LVQADVKLVIFSLSGRMIATLVNGHQEAGDHYVSWNGRDNTGRLVPSGVYYYSLSTGVFAISRAMVFLR
ncbi:FlgD immunoglobulin-like domain containing protein, partial [Candidatus Neomarinimicrobiota bacterium]